jgi:hypothetical protein
MKRKPFQPFKLIKYINKRFISISYNRVGSLGIRLALQLNGVTIR